MLIAMEIHTRLSIVTVYCLYSFVTCDSCRLFVFVAVTIKEILIFTRLSPGQIKEIWQIILRQTKTALFKKPYEMLEDGDVWNNTFHVPPNIFSWLCLKWKLDRNRVVEKVGLLFWSACLLTELKGFFFCLCSVSCNFKLVERNSNYGKIPSYVTFCTTNVSKCGIMSAKTEQQYFSHTCQDVSLFSPHV